MFNITRVNLPIITVLTIDWCSDNTFHFAAACQYHEIVTTTLLSLLLSFNDSRELINHFITKFSQISWINKSKTVLPKG